MATRMTIASVASFAVLAASSVATAQGNGPLPRDGACFYEDTNYRGQYFCFVLAATSTRCHLVRTTACLRFEFSVEPMSGSIGTPGSGESLCNSIPVSVIWTMKTSTTRSLPSVSKADRLVAALVAGDPGRRILS